MRKRCWLNYGLTPANQERFRTLRFMRNGAILAKLSLGSKPRFDCAILASTRLKQTLFSILCARSRDSSHSSVRSRESYQLSMSDGSWPGPAVCEQGTLSNSRRVKRWLEACRSTMCEATIQLQQRLG